MSWRSGGQVSLKETFEFLNLEVTSGKKSDRSNIVKVEGYVIYSYFLLN